MAQQHSDETKAAVLAALLTGQSVSEVARAYELPEGTVKSWRSRAKSQTVATVATPKKENIGEMLIRYLEDNLIALRAQLVVFSDPDWLRKQTAADAAVLHGVMTDKAIRLLEALSKAPEGGSDDAA